MRISETCNADLFEPAEINIEERITEAHSILDQAIGKCSGKEIKGIIILFSGGNDSTVLAHIFKDRATHAAHANTGIGVEQTRQFVRDTCASWELPLLERHPPEGEGYRELVLGGCMIKTGPHKGGQIWGKGFPVPSTHWMMYQRLKERALNQIRRELITNPRKERVLFLAGRRAGESARRKHLATADPVEFRGSTVWVSPIVQWSNEDLTAYRKLFPDMPRNEIADILHMSGECLCGCFARPGQLAEFEFLGNLFGNESILEAVQTIREMETEAAERGLINPTWGAGNWKKPSRSGPLCSSCETQFTDSLFKEEIS